MKYVAILEYNDYDDYGHRVIPFEGSEQELDDLRGKFQEAIHWYVQEHNRIYKEYNSLAMKLDSISYKKQKIADQEKVKQLMTELNNIRFLDIGGYHVDVKLLGFNSSIEREIVGHSFEMYVPLFITLDEYFDQAKKNISQCIHYNRDGTPLKKF